jgi:hypothetical protein
MLVSAAVSPHFSAANAVRIEPSHPGPLMAFADHVSLKLRTQPILPVKP